MRQGFVKTENYARFTAGVKAVEERGAAEAGMMLVHGQPGLGKSHIVYRWAEEAGAIFLRANVDWTPKYFLVELAKALNLDTRGTAQALFERCLRVLIERQCPIIIDEAEFTLADRAAVLEKIRDFSDRAEVTVVLIGMEQIQRNISRYKQISSRIAQVVEFGPATASDVALACAKLCEFELSPALTAEVLRLSAGRMREVLNILARIERLARANGLEGTLDVAQFAGQELARDWQSRTAKTVRPAKAAA
ncbi:MULTISPECIES: ATP-binding protein [unclassified Desulfovibrio]|uniref:AAA family ATPase n=1 Tax=unclassified Desulfovibrio TaxID=2593640 RepID=UPI0013EB8D83|nr:MULTISPECIES: ATP-binding protein [unclassified Desulfovibrio]MDE6735766.1 ATP-binding protein [Desulfovibrio sp.]